MNMEITSLSSSAVLVDLNISMWTARKMDKKVSEEIDQAKGTKARAGNFHKNLFAGDNLIEQMNKMVNKIRDDHYQLTQPWSDSGTRLLTMGNFMKYNSIMQTAEVEFNNYKDKLLAEYNSMVSTAAFTLGDLFNRDDYPTVDSIASKFRFNYVYSPVPEFGDFRVDIANEGIKELIGKYESQVETRVKAAMKDAWERLHDCLSRMSERLDFTGDGADKKIFRDSLVDNALELIEVLQHMNITRDPELEKSRKQLEKAISTVSAKELRDSPEIRKDVKAEVDDILKRMSF